MNRELLDPFQNSFPEIIEETLESGAGATTCAFNRRGSMLATGCADGRVIIWDFDTRGVAQTLTGHVLGYPVTSVNWSRTGRHLVSSSIDWNVNLYDVLSGSVEASIQMDGQVLYAQLHPRKNNICIVSVHFEDHPYLVDFSTKTKTQLPIPDEEGHDQKKSSKSSATHGVFAVFNKAGNKVYCGNSRGLIYVIDVKSLKILYSFKVPGGALIKFIQFSKSGKQFLVNSSDRIIRVYEGEDSKTAAREFQDPVNRMQWKKCCFSSDGEFLIGGSAQKSQHNIYIWNREVGPLVKTLEGPKEGIMDLVWHPTRPVIVSLATSGVCYIWGCNYTENWSAFAPDFKELEENEEYNEKEEEFDEIDHTENLKKRKISQEEGVDILTTDKVAYWSSDEEDDLVLVPVIIKQVSVAHPP